MRSPHRNHIAPPQGGRNAHRLSVEIDVHPNQLTDWKTQLLENASGFFVTAAEKQVTTPDLKDLRAKIGQQTSESDLLSCALGRIGNTRDKDHDLPFVR